jgi:tetratricopeptide (TPR) repeat protein
MQAAQELPPIPAAPLASNGVEQISPPLQGSPVRSTHKGAEDLLSQMAGSSTKDEALKQVAEAVLTSTASLPENIRIHVAQSMQDIQKYINHGLLTPATEACLHVIDMAPQYLDVHQVLCEIYVRQGKVEQAITKYAILVDTYVVNGRLDDAIATYRRILQLEPNNLTYRMRLINLLSSQGNKEDLLRERTLAAESYLRLGYMDRALTELEQALQESPTSVPTRLNYALALQKLGRGQQAVAEYQRVLQVDPRNITALVRWHIAMIVSLGTARATTVEVLTRIRWQLRGEGQRHYDAVVREYTSTSETHPNNADVHFALGQIHQQAGNYDKAVSAYQLAMRDSAVDVLARVSTAQCLLSQGKPEDAIQQLEQALQAVRRNATGSVDPGTWAARPREEGEEHQAPEVEISMLLAKAYGRTGKQEQMQAILRQIKQSTTYQDEVTSALAEISARQGDVKNALQEYADLVRHYRSKRQTENALSVLNEMVRMDPQDARAHDELADIYMNRGLLDEAIAELRLLASIYQRQNQAEQAGATLQRIGTIYAEAGDTEEALINLRRAVDLMPNSMELLREVVGFCLQLNRYQDAAPYQVVIARHYFETHQVKEAVAALQQLITIDRNNYEAYDLLGQTYQSVGEYEQASRVYRNLAKVNPENSIARERLATLQELRAK